LMAFLFSDSLGLSWLRCWLMEAMASNIIVLGLLDYTIWWI